MALMINVDDCNSCAACESECPNDAISEGDTAYTINSDKCTECVGHFDESQCAAACPSEAIVPDTNHSESKDDLLKKYQRLTA